MARRVVAAVAVLVSVASTGQPGPAVSEAALKAAFVYKFTRFIEWPDEGRGCPEVATVAVLGDDAPVAELREAVAGRRSQGREVQIVRVHDVADIKACSLVWVATREASQPERLLRKLRGVPVVVVSDAPGFARRGGTIGLVMEDGRIAFEINVGAASAARIQISSRLLTLGRVVQTES